VDLEGLGVPRLPQPLDGIRVPEKVRPDPFVQTRPFSGLLYDLPSCLPADGEKSVVQIQLSVEGIAFEPVGQVIGTGNHAGLFTFAPDVQDRMAIVSSNRTRTQRQSLGDPQPSLEEKQNQKGISPPVPPPASLGNLAGFFRGEIGDNLGSPGELGFRRSKGSFFGHGKLLSVF